MSIVINMLQITGVIVILLVHTIQTDVIPGPLGLLIVRQDQVYTTQQSLKIYFELKWEDFANQITNLTNTLDGIEGQLDQFINKELLQYSPREFASANNLTQARIC